MRPFTLLTTVALLCKVTAWTAPGRLPSQVLSPTTRRRRPLFRSSCFKDDNNQKSPDLSRRHVFSLISSTIVATMSCSVAVAAEHPALFTRQTEQFKYHFAPPPSVEQGNKPLRTHLDEVNWNGPNQYQFGITVDPVRIDSLQQFGSPEQVAAKVVLAELGRDGVFDVKLMGDPMSNTKDGVEYYQLDYLSTGKRGNKRFVAKFYIADNKLYALTAQCKADDWDVLQSELLAAVDSFRILL